jgi:hypothetical protein
MSAYSEKIANQKRGFYRAADFEGDVKEITHEIAYLLEDQVIFDESKDVLCFSDTGRQLQVNTTNAETLISLFGNEPDGWASQRVTLYLAPYGSQGKLGIRLKSPTPSKPVSGNGVAKEPTQVTDTRSLASAIDNEIPF